MQINGNENIQKTKLGFRADSCENTINNTHSSMINILENNRNS